ncbi:hypothetical protein SDC9_171850 [bioreactor metagenome]|uniref:Uncharacterized protein n=1 Tax=bioreactor metagenome TaxID=1076179 RepID=A0A645GC25_9ZZZZ
MVGKAGLTTMQPRHLAHQRQPQPGAFLAGRRSGQGVEAVEELRQGVVGGAGAVVADADFGGFGGWT